MKLKSWEATFISIDKISNGLFSHIKSWFFVLRKLSFFKLNSNLKKNLNNFRGLHYLKEENLKGDEEEEDIKKISELSQALLMNLALSNFKVNVQAS